jgi:hypothetical protein
MLKSSPFVMLTSDVANTDEVASDPFVSDREDRQEKKASQAAFLQGHIVEQEQLNDIFFTSEYNPRHLEARDQNLIAF